MCSWYGLVAVAEAVAAVAVCSAPQIQGGLELIALMGFSQRAMLEMKKGLRAIMAGEAGSVDFGLELLLIAHMDGHTRDRDSSGISHRLAVHGKLAASGEGS